MRKRTEIRLLDEMVSAYDDWEEASRLVRDAYRSWAGATGPRARVAFWRYMSALDAEEWAAEVYASLVRGAGHVTASYDDPSGPLTG
jgi:hypothetical protein